MDVVDVAQGKIEAEQDDIQARGRAVLARGDNFCAVCGVHYCADCGCEIEAARSAAVPGCQFCVDCQEERECLKRY